MTAQPHQIEYVRTCYPLAAAAGKFFGMNPYVILAQGAHESDWGRSYAVKTRHNFFGILAIGSANPWWDGKSKSASLKNPKLVFRVYRTAADSFFDYARLITKKYPHIAALSADTAAFARAMAGSDYITEDNGDDREAYARSLTSGAVSIAAIAHQLKFA